MSFNINPFTLFLILILLVLSTDKQVDTKLSMVRELLDQTSRSLGSLREGIEAMQTSFQQARTIFHTLPSRDADKS